MSETEDGWVETCGVGAGVVVLVVLVVVVGDGLAAVAVRARGHGEVAGDVRGVGAARAGRRPAPGRAHAAPPHVLLAEARLAAQARVLAQPVARLACTIYTHISDLVIYFLPIVFPIVSNFQIRSRRMTSATRHLQDS